MPKNDKRMRIRGGGFRPLTGVVLHSWPQSLFDPHPDPITYAYTDREPYNKLQQMVDTHGFLRDDFNPCYHERYVGKSNFPSYVAVVDGNGDTHSYSYSHKRQLLDPILDCRSLDVPLGTWLEDFSARAENHFLVLVKTEWSPINFLIEMIQLLEGNVKILDRIRNTIKGLYDNFWRKYRETGNYWLAWNFAIKPTIDDVKSALNVYKKAYKRLLWLRERNHKDTKVKYREGPRNYEFESPFELNPAVWSSPRIHPDPGPGPLYTDWVTWVVIDQRAGATCFAEVRLTSWAWIRFDIDDALLDGLPGLGIVMAAMQGLYNPLQIGWDAVPYSWLIDWFRSEAHKLRETLKSDLSPLGTATIKQAGWSCKMRVLGTFYHERRGSWLTNPSPGDTGWLRTDDCGGFVYNLYVRQPELPITGSSPFRIPWEWYNAGILAALIQQKTRRG